MKFYQPIGRASSQGVDSIFRGFAKTESGGLILYEIFTYLISVATLPIRLLIRKNIGERSIGILSFLLALVFTGAFFFFFHFANLSFHLIDFKENIIFSSLMIIFLTILNPTFWFMIILIREGFLHFKKVIKRAKSFDISHSYHRGDGKYFEDSKGKIIWGFVADDSIIRMIVEPRAIVEMGFYSGLISYGLLSLFDQYLIGYLYLFFIFLNEILGVAILLLISGIFLFIEEYIFFARKRDAILDIIDSEIDMKELFEIKEKYKTDDDFE